MALLDPYVGVVLDVDGVLCRGQEPVDGAGATVAALRERGLGIAVVTNNASRTPRQLADWLRGLDIAVDPGEIVTAAQAAATLVEPGSLVLAVGMDGIREALTERGCALTEDPNEATAVVVGIDLELTYDTLRRATTALMNGARFIGANPDPSFPSAEGIQPGNGAILAALQAASGRTPEIAGKPEAPVFATAAAKLPDGPLLMVGDRVETDIVGAARLGWDTALVLTGVREEEPTAGAEYAPTYVLRSVNDLLDRTPDEPAENVR